jgi:hypothetical protein
VVLAFHLDAVDLAKDEVFGLLARALADQDSDTAVLGARRKATFTASPVARLSRRSRP